MVKDFCFWVRRSAEKVLRRVEEWGEAQRGVGGWGISSQADIIVLEATLIIQSISFWKLFYLKLSQKSWKTAL